MIGTMTTGARTSTARAVLASLLALSFNVDVFVSGHGYMSSPRARNWVAHEDGVDGTSTPNSPPKDHCPHCLNTSTQVCGKTSNNDYDDYKDSMGNLMNWNSQALYTEGQVIDVKSHLSTHHNGHMIIAVCDLGNDSTRDCFKDDKNLLTFVSDPLYGMPGDPDFPERGYYSGGQDGGIQDFEMKFKLPDGVTGDEVLLQWRYITANSCSPEGYPEYFAANSDLPDSFWTVGLKDKICLVPYNDDGTVGEKLPEQFFNCAEVSILPSVPTVSPVPTASPVVPPPTVSTTTTTAAGCCSQDFATCPVANWCSGADDSQFACEACNGDNHWIAGPQTGCKYMYQGQNGEDCGGCCPGLTCVKDPNGGDYNQCLYVENPDTTTTTTTSSSSSSTTTTVATTTTTTQPAPQPGCYSNDFKNCNHPAFNSTGDSCTTVWLPDGEPTDGCIALWGGCGVNGNCCGSATCFGDEQTGKQCVVPSDWEPPATTGESSQTRFLRKGSGAV